MRISLKEMFVSASVTRYTPILIFIALICSLSCGIAAADDLVIYSDSLASGWENWSWDASVDFSDTSPVYNGTRSMAVTITSAWGSLYLHSTSSIALGYYEKISFWIYGNSGTGNLRLVLNGTDYYSFTAPAGTWTNITVPFSAMGSPASLSELYWQDTSGANQSFSLDDITLIEYASPPPAPNLTVNALSGRHAISEDIYGMNYADEDLAAEIRLPVRRWGGNSTSRYNWQNDTYNTGSDWYFENIAAQNSGSSNLPDGSSADLFVEQDRRTGSKTIMTIPMIGWVAKRRLESHPYDCGFKVSKYGAQQSVDTWDTDCGNGVASGGSNITGNDPADTSSAVGADFVSPWIAHLTGKYGTAANSGVAFYNLDNEPMLWNSTHRDVHPAATTYDEMRNLTYQYAAAIKSADPSAKTLGPVLWGWCAYFYSSNDECSEGSDYYGHGDMYFVPWYLQQMQAYEQQYGVRILDYLDLHNYPQAGGVYGSAVDSSTQALRLRSTRSLWDPTYVDESWIDQAIRLIPRMRDWVNTYYPGTKLAITEYNWGALGSINGALAQADILGIFGRERLDLATLWGPPTYSQPAAYAFRIYRNYDGLGHGFGEMSVQASSTDQGKLSVYAAERSSDHALTVVVINKTSQTLTSKLTISGASPTAAKVYRYSSSNLSAIEQLSDISVSGSSFTTDYAPNSITLFVMTPGSTTGTCSDQAVTIEGTSNYYTIIQTAYAGAATDQSILAQAMDFNEELNFSGDVDIKLKGGYYCDFASTGGKSVINGSLTVKGGSLTIENIIIR